MEITRNCSTGQSLLFNNKYQNLLAPTDFDLVISDEAPRSIGGNSRAGIIVPEGIIFQSQTAYTQLRKMLVEEYLVVQHLLV